MPSSAPACAIVIFGASGDLAKRKLLPALFQLAREKLLNERTCIVGFSRTAMRHEQFRAELAQAVREHARTQPADAATLAALESRSYYVAGDYGSVEDHARLRVQLDQLDEQHSLEGNRLFYLATPPAAFEPIIERLGERQPPPTSASAGSPWRRIIIEKPFGYDLASARRLNELLHRHFSERQIFRIDHFLGKETVQNLLVLRFANSILEPIWNYKYIDHVQITVGETLGVEQRGGYYDRAGALRDMVQNHIFQLMALVAMEPPAALDADSIRDEKVKVFRSLRPMRSSLVPQLTVRGQYAAGPENADYQREKGVAPQSRTETFVAAKLFIDNWRWSGMPFYLRTGKCLPEKLSEVVVRFRSPPLALFQKQCESPVYPNDLILRVQPDEGVRWRLNGKVPGGQLNIQSVAMDFLYRTTFKAAPPDAYERLIHDAILGEQTLFIRSDEAEAAWAALEPILLAWAADSRMPHQYQPGTWGPAEAAELIERDGRRWMHSNDEPDPIIACSL